MPPFLATRESSWRFEAGLCAVGLAVLCWSASAPRDRFTWWLEVLPVLVALPLLVATRARLRWTRLAYTLFLIHAVVLMVGGHWTYAEVPAGDWVAEHLGLTRNPYDRLGHFAQGFVPAIAARELLLRCTPLVRGGWLFFLVVCVCLAISASYELLEWSAALATGARAEAFLGMQGDPWDTQWDMFLALCGSLCAQLALARKHERELQALA